MIPRVRRAAKPGRATRRAASGFLEHARTSRHLPLLRLPARREPGLCRGRRGVGRALAERGIGLIYGGGRIGLMGVAADAALAGGGAVVGIIPEPLALREVAHDGLTELIVVPGMHERKALMAQRSDAFLALPGGVGTFEEFFEILTWAVLGLHNKPIGLLNVAGYFDPLRAMLRHSVRERFVRPEHLDLLLVDDDPERNVRRLPKFVPPPPGPKWIDLDQT
jgi:uncharacterized protein (TIGR00730 family)